MEHYLLNRLISTPMYQTRITPHQLRSCVAKYETCITQRACRIQDAADVTYTQYNLLSNWLSNECCSVTNVACVYKICHGQPVSSPHNIVRYSFIRRQRARGPARPHARVAGSRGPASLRTHAAAAVYRVVVGAAALSRPPPLPAAGRGRHRPHLPPRVRNPASPRTHVQLSTI